MQFADPIKAAAQIPSYQWWAKAYLVLGIIGAIITGVVCCCLHIIPYPGACIFGSMGITVLCLRRSYHCSTQAELRFHGLRLSFFIIALTVLPSNTKSP